VDLTPFGLDNPNDVSSPPNSRTADRSADYPRRPLRIFRTIGSEARRPTPAHLDGLASVMAPQFIARRK